MIGMDQISLVIKGNVLDLATCWMLYVEEVTHEVLWSSDWISAGCEFRYLLICVAMLLVSLLDQGIFYRTQFLISLVKLIMFNLPQ